MTELVLGRLPIHLPHIDPLDPAARGDWDVIAPAILARMATAVRALFRLTPDDSWLAAEALARTVIELVITFSWLAAKPETHLAEWLAGSDWERLSADNKHTKWLVERRYKEAAEPLLSPDLRAAVEEEARKITSLAELALLADKAWRERVPELAAPECAFAEIYAHAYSHYSGATRALIQPLYRYTGAHPDGGVFVGPEGNDDSSTPWGIGLLVLGLGLLVSAEALGWPDPKLVRAAIVAAR